MDIETEDGDEFDILDVLLMHRSCLELLQNNGYDMNYHTLNKFIEPHISK